MDDRSSEPVSNPHKAATSFPSSSSSLTTAPDLNSTVEPDLDSYIGEELRGHGRSSPNKERGGGEANVLPPLLSRLPHRERRT
jgi:hypothetical protein